MVLHMPWDFKTQKIVAQLLDSVRAQWLALDKVFVGYLTARSLKLNVITAPVTDRETLEVCVVDFSSAISLHQTTTLRN